MSCQHKYKNCKSVCKSPPLRDGFCTLHYKQKEKETRLKKFNEENNNIVVDKNTIEEGTSSDYIINVTNNKSYENIINNEKIFPDEQKAYIISKFPKKLHEYLNKVNNPLDETQVIVSLLKEKNIRIVLNYEENMFGIYEWKGYYHATDIETKAGCSRVDNWSRWNINFKKFCEFENKNLVPQFEGQENSRPVYNFDIKKINTNALFIDDEGLKTVLIKTTKQSTEIDMFKEWIIKYSTIAKNIISMIIQIKQQYEYEQLKNQLNNNKIICKSNEITYFYDENDITPFLHLNVVYLGETGEIITKNNKECMVYKLGKSYRAIDRDFKEHKKTFTNFRMILILHCDNNDVVEDYLKIELKAKDMLYDLPKKNKNNDNEVENTKIQIEILNPKQVYSKQSVFSETFILTDKFDLRYVMDLMKRLVDEHPLKSIKERDDKIRELESDKEIQKMNIELKMKEEETKQKEIDKEKEIKLAEIKLEMMKLKYNCTQQNTFDNQIDDNISDIDDNEYINDKKDDYDNILNVSSKEKKIKTIEDLIDSPDIDSEEYERLEIKKGKNKATGIEKLSIKKFILKRKLKIESFAYETDEQKKELIDFLSCWYNKEYILDNALCALGKKQYNDVDDPYFSNMGIKIEYLNKILNIFGFKGLLDFETKVKFNEELEKRMIASRLLTKANYSRMMKTFGKQERANDLEGKFEKDKFIKICNCVVNEFGFKIQSERKHKKNNQKCIWLYNYTICENMKDICNIINK